MRYIFHIIFIFFASLLTASAQEIRGTITDADTGDTLAFASVQYKGHNIAAVSDINGQYVIQRHEGWNITFSAVGYKSRIVQVPCQRCPVEP